MRDASGIKTDIPLQPTRCSHEKDLIIFTVAGLTPVPCVNISHVSPMQAPDRHVIFIHWSPAVDVDGGLLGDEGFIVGKSRIADGQYLASLRSHKGSCGGGVFFKMDGTLAGIHQGIEHESEESTGKVTRKGLETLKGQKDAYTYFIGCVELSNFVED
jgi:hypothetical protein